MSLRLLFIVIASTLLLSSCVCSRHEQKTEQHVQEWLTQGLDKAAEEHGWDADFNALAKKEHLSRRELTGILLSLADRQGADQILTGERLVSVVSFADTGWLPELAKVGGQDMSFRHWVLTLLCEGVLADASQARFVMDRNDVSPIVLHRWIELRKKSDRALIKTVASMFPLSTYDERLTVALILLERESLDMTGQDLPLEGWTRENGDCLLPLHKPVSLRLRDHKLDLDYPRGAYAE